jgi:hypothetical protein
VGRRPHIVHQMSIEEAVKVLVRCSQHQTITGHNQLYGQITFVFNVRSHQCGRIDSTPRIDQKKKLAHTTS